MSNTDKLTKKERKYYSALLAKKLETLGIRDEIVMSGTGVAKLFYKTGLDGRVVFDAKGKPERVVAETLMGKNPLRNLIKKLRNGSRDAVESFLALDNQALVIPEPVAKVEAPNQEGILIEPVTESK